MQAVIRDGGRQYKVQEGDRLEVDFRKQLEPGSTIEFPEVLLIEDGDASRIGAPLVDGAKVVGKVVDHVQGEKLIIMHFRRRKNSRRRVGHRQKYTQVQIEAIQG